MVCTRCGAKLKDNDLFCLKCGQEVQIVPDYSPVEEIVIRNVVEAQTDDDIQDTDAQITVIDEMEQTKALESVEKIQKRIIILCAIAAVIVIATIAINVLLFIRHNNSVEYQKACAYVEIENKSYEKALQHLERALDLNDADLEIRVLITETYINLNNLEMAIETLKDIINLDRNNTDAAVMLVELYSENNMIDEISAFFDEIKGTQLYSSMKDYHVNSPVFNIESGEYERFVAVEISCEDNCLIYYTIDGTTPTTESAVPYSGIIRLPNGTTTIKAIAVNEKGIKSDETVAKYTVHYNAPGNPAIYPSEGGYYYAQPITIGVPENCTVYFTTDGSIPTENSKKYTGYIDMPLGNSTISAVAIDKNGFVSKTINASFTLEFDTRFTLEQAAMIISAHLANNLEDERGVFELNCAGAYAVGEFNLYMFEKVYGIDIYGHVITSENEKFAFDVLTGETYIATPDGAGNYSLQPF